MNKDQYDELLELSIKAFELKEYKSALKSLILCYEYSRSNEIAEFILANYYEPNLEELEFNYKSNLEKLKCYKEYYGDLIVYEEIMEKPVWSDSEELIFFEEDKFHTIATIDPALFQNSNKSIVIINPISLDDIAAFEQESKKLYPREFIMLNYLSPICICFDPVILHCIMMVTQIKNILNDKRIIILNGEKEACKWFADEQTVCDVLVGSLEERDNKYKRIILNEKERMDDLSIKRLKNIEEYYLNNKCDIRTRVRRGKPKVLFITSCFTTAIQYHTMNFMEAIQKKELETKTVIEDSYVKRIKNQNLIKEIYEFKPDIIIQIDHLRKENNSINTMPDGLFHLCWIQDPMEPLLDKESVQYLMDTDYILNHYISWNKFEEVGYPKEKVIAAPIPANQRIYKPYDLTKFEQEIYGCDINFVCHGGDAETAINDYCDLRGDMGIMKIMLRQYYEYMYKGDKCYCSEKEILLFFENFLDSFEVCEEEKSLYISYIQSDINNIQILLNLMLRNILIQWIIEAGFDNIQLWGNGWENSPKYKKYAKGSAENGEVLSKIYQSAKIVIGNNGACTAAARAWESMLSGAFYLSNYLPPEDDVVDIRMILKEKEEVVFYYNKKDMLDKIGYYLKHEEERIKMAEIGRKCALERMTFDIMADNVLTELKNRV